VCIATFLIAKIAITAKIAKIENLLFPLCCQPGSSKDCSQLSGLIKQWIKTLFFDHFNISKQLDPKNSFICFFTHDTDLGYEFSPGSSMTSSTIICADRSTRP